MRILQIIKPLGMGGVERISVSLHKTLKNQGHESYIAINWDMRERFIQHFNLADDETIVSYDAPNMIQFICSLKKLIRDISPDIIQTHARQECFVVSILNKKIPHIRTQHMAETPKLKVTYLEKALLKNRVSTWIATSLSLKKHYLGSLSYINQENVTPVYNGVPCAAKRKAETYEPTFKYCIIARLTIQKGIDILIEAMSKMSHELLKAIQVDIYGEGEEKESILKMIEQYNLGHSVKYCGTTNNPSDIVIHYDALLMPSRYEGLPLTMLEAMSTGTPVATHNVGCVEEFIQHDQNSWMINEHYSWAKFFEEALKNNAKYHRVSQEALNTYLSNFSEEKMVEGYLSVYRKGIKNTKDCGGI